MNAAHTHQISVEAGSPCSMVFISREAISGIEDSKAMARSVKPIVQVSSTGRYVAYSSAASGVRQVYRYDATNASTTVFSVSTGGATGNDDSQDAVISDDGKAVAFISHATNLAGLAGVKLKYVSDPVPQAAAELAQKLGAQVASVDDVLGDPGVDAVAICSSTDTHSDLIVRAARARKHIFCEKPVDLDIARAREVVAAAEGSGAKLNVANTSCRLCVCVCSNCIDNLYVVIRSYIIARN